MRRFNGAYCCIPYCTSCSGNGHKLYLVPSGGKKRFGRDTKDWAAKFHQVLYRYRLNPKFKRQVESGKAFICGNHFERSEIVTTTQKSWLQPGALPTLQLPKKTHESNPVKKRRQIIKCLPNIVKAPLYRTIDDVDKGVSKAMKSLWRKDRVDSKLHFTLYHDNEIHGVPAVSFLLFKHHDAFACTIAFSGIYAKELSNQFSLTHHSINFYLESFSKMRSCPGYSEVIDEGPWSKRWISQKFRYNSINCLGTCQTDSPCNECMKLNVRQQDSLIRKTSRLEKLKNQPLSSRATIETVSKERLQDAVVGYRCQISDLIKELHMHGRSVSNEMECMIEKCAEDDDFLKEWFATQRQLPKCSKNGRRYPPSIIRYCLVLFAKSPSAYKHLQRIMVLPSARTLRRKRVEQCGLTDYGFQDSVAKRLKREIMESEKESDKMVIISVDEMSIQKDLVFRSSTGDIVGYVDFGDSAYNGISKSSSMIATHMLTFFVRGITNNKLDGVIAYYPTAGIDGSDLFFVLMDLLVELQLQTGCVISGIVADGLAANRSAINTFVSPEDDIPHRMKNPLNPDKYIYFLPDVPHLLKTCRNCLLSHCRSMWNGGDIHMDPIKCMIRNDMKLGELRFFPQLDERHICPSPWEKMSVSIAAKILSFRVGTAMKQRGHNALAEYILTIDKWFDYANAGFQQKNPKTCRQPYYNCEDHRLLWLERDFIQYLDEWEERVMSRPLVGSVNRGKMLLSKPTQSGLRMASKSIVALERDIG